MTCAQAYYSSRDAYDCALSTAKKIVRREQEGSVPEGHAERVIKDNLKSRRRTMELIEYTQVRDPELFARVEKALPEDIFSTLDFFDAANGIGRAIYQVMIDDIREEANA